jgi:hypothetical protein
VSTYIGTVAIYDPVFFCRLLGWRGLPHEALDVRCPAELYTASTRPYDGLPELTYPFRDVLVTADGSAFIARRSTSQPRWPKGLRYFDLVCSVTYVSGLNTADVAEGEELWSNLLHVGPHVTDSNQAYRAPTTASA